MNTKVIDCGGDLPSIPLSECGEINKWDIDTLSIEAQRAELLRKAKSVGLIYSPKPKKQETPLQIGSYKYKAR